MRVWEKLREDVLDAETEIGIGGMIRCELYARVCSSLAAGVGAMGWADGEKGGCLLHFLGLAAY